MSGNVDSSGTQGGHHVLAYGPHCRHPGIGAAAETENMRILVHHVGPNLVADGAIRRRPNVLSLSATADYIRPIGAHRWRGHVLHTTMAEWTQSQCECHDY